MQDDQVVTDTDLLCHRAARMSDDSQRVGCLHSGCRESRSRKSGPSCNCRPTTSPHRSCRALRFAERPCPSSRWRTWFPRVVVWCELPCVVEGDLGFLDDHACRATTTRAGSGCDDPVAAVVVRRNVRDSCAVPLYRQPSIEILAELASTNDPVPARDDWGDPPRARFVAEVLEDATQDDRSLLTRWCIRTIDPDECPVPAIHHHI